MVRILLLVLIHRLIVFLPLSSVGFLSYLSSWPQLYFVIWRFNVFDDEARRQSNKFVNYFGTFVDDTLLRLAHSFSDQSRSRTFLYFTGIIKERLSILYLGQEDMKFDVGYVVEPHSLKTNCAVVSEKLVDGTSREVTIHLTGTLLQSFLESLSIIDSSSSLSNDTVPNSNSNHEHPTLNWVSEKPELSSDSNIQQFATLPDLASGSVISNSLSYHSDIGTSPNLQSSFFLGLIIKFLSRNGEDPGFIVSSLLPNVTDEQLYGNENIFVTKMGVSLFTKLLKPIAPLPKGVGISNWSTMLKYSIGGQSVLQWVLDGLWTSCFKMAQLFLVVDDMDNFIASFIASCYVNAYKVASLSPNKRVLAASSEEFHLSYNISNTTFSKYFVTYAFVNGALSPLGRVLSNNGLLTVFKRNDTKHGVHCVVASGANDELTVVFDSWPGLLDNKVSLDYRCDVVVLRQQGNNHSFDWWKRSLSDTIAGWKSEYALASMKFDFWDRSYHSKEILSSSPAPSHLVAGGGTLDVVLGDLVGNFLGVR